MLGHAFHPFVLLGGRIGVGKVLKMMSLFCVKRDLHYLCTELFREKI